MKVDVHKRQYCSLLTLERGQVNLLADDKFNPLEMDLTVIGYKYYSVYEATTADGRAMRSDPFEFTDGFFIGEEMHVSDVDPDVVHESAIDVLAYVRSTGCSRVVVHPKGLVTPLHDGDVAIGTGVKH